MRTTPCAGRVAPCAAKSCLHIRGAHWNGPRGFCAPLRVRLTPNESPYNNEQLRELVSSQARAVSVARRQRPSLELESYFSNLLELLEEARKPGASDGGEEHFEELLDFFERLGQASLSGAHEEATAIGMPAWMSPSPTGVF